MKNSKQKIILTDVAYWNNAIVHWLAIAIVFINISVVILFVFYIQPSELPLRLQYNVFFGTSLHAPWWNAYMLPAMSFIFFIIDLVIGYILYRAHERIAAYSALLGGLFASVALFIAALSIILNNHVL
ncbi:MAG TPA: hypothetical protein EYG99_00395 [Candidatus Pacebacteria bacterium]|nr:hypothetical protein [Candidatus Paceibacterota bacterium]